MRLIKGMHGLDAEHKQAHNYAWFRIGVSAETESECVVIRTVILDSGIAFPLLCLCSPSNVNEASFALLMTSFLMRS
jgi:hypothetical protein